MHQGRLVFAQAQTSTRPARSTVAKTVNERREAMLTLHNLGGEDNGWVRTEGRVLFGVEVFPLLPHRPILVLLWKRDPSVFTRTISSLFDRWDCQGTLLRNSRPVFANQAVRLRHR
jgi:hypothetical protein